MNNQDLAPLPDANRFDALKPGGLNREEKESVIKLALSVLAERHRAGRALGSPEQTRSFLQLKIATAGGFVIVGSEYCTGTLRRPPPLDRLPGQTSAPGARSRMNRLLMSLVLLLGVLALQQPQVAAVEEELRFESCRAVEADGPDPSSPDDGPCWIAATADRLACRPTARIAGIAATLPTTAANPALAPRRTRAPPA